jgi:hypothetical protein
MEAQMTEQETIKKAIADLRECDHTFLSEKGVKKFADVFGVTLTPTLHYADPSHPKGLTFHDGAKSAVGMDAADMAETICLSLGVPTLPLMGRGFRLQSCCDALAKHFNVGSFDNPRYRNADD